MYENVNHNDCKIKVACNNSESNIIYLQTLNDNDRIYFITKFANLCQNSVLILSDNDSIDDFKWPDFKQSDIPRSQGVPHLIAYDYINENFDIPWDELFQIHINIEKIDNGQLLKLLLELKNRSKNGGKISLIIDKFDSLSNKIRLIIDNYDSSPNEMILFGEQHKNQTFGNIFSNNITLICNRSIDEKLCNSILTYLIRNIHENLYDVTDENNDVTCNGTTLDKIELISI